jgi:hypothetical protein
VDHPVQQGLPTGRRYAVVACLGLLERVVDRDRIVNKRGAAGTGEDTPEAILKKFLRAALAVVTVRVRHEFLGFRCKQRAEQFRVNAPQ